MKFHYCPSTEKKCFPSRLHAEIRILSLEKQTGYPLYSYHCRHCGSWHLTRTPDFVGLVEMNLL